MQKTIIELVKEEPFRPPREYTSMVDDVAPLLKKVEKGKGAWFRIATCGSVSSAQQLRTRLKDAYPDFQFRGNKECVYVRHMNGQT